MNCYVAVGRRCRPGKIGFQLYTVETHPLALWATLVTADGWALTSHAGASVVPLCTVLVNIEASPLGKD